MQQIKKALGFLLSLDDGTGDHHWVICIVTFGKIDRSFVSMIIWFRELEIVADRNDGTRLGMDVIARRGS